MGKKKVDKKSGNTAEAAKDGSMASSASSRSGKQHRRESNSNYNSSGESSSSSMRGRPNSMSQWLSNDYEGLFWFLGCVILGGILGFAIGAGWTDFSGTVSPWRTNLGRSIRASTAYQLATLQPDKWEMLWDDCIVWIIAFQRQAESKVSKKKRNHILAHVKIRSSHC
jgi:hypothetical protein